MFGLTRVANTPVRYPLQKPDAEWRRILPPDAYQVLRQEGTERPGTSPLLNEHRSGAFRCRACNWPLFSSRNKFESGTGWPSFDRPINGRAVAQITDTSLFMSRTAVNCANCGGHLGHVFNDGPILTTGLRYCMNGVAMTFQPGPA